MTNPVATRRTAPNSLLLAPALGALLALAAPARAQTPPTFSTHACDLPDTADVLPRLRCGTVLVPRDWRHPNGPTFALAVVVIASAQQPAQADPVVYISGGPGAPLTIYAGYQARHPYAPDRDLILLDQRGTGRSEPRLCPDRQRELLGAMLAVATDPTPSALEADRAAHVACRADIVARGIDPNDFGTTVTAEDFEQVRQALHIARWNVIGESYGTEVALTLLANHPAPIRSAVLDSLDPPDPYLGGPWSGRVARARDALLAACGRAPICGPVEPAPATLYRDALERLRQDPPPLKLPRWGQADRLTPSLFQELVGRLVYYPPNYPGLAALLAATRNGDMRPAESALASLLDGAAQHGNEGAFAAVECRDRPGWRESATDRTALDLALLPPALCDAWSALEPLPDLPRQTAVPTLVLAGAFDPNIAPDQSRHVADLIGARWVEVEAVGHSVRHFSPCAQRLVARFIAKPTEALDASCAAQPPVPPAAPPPHPDPVERR